MIRTAALIISAGMILTGITIPMVRTTERVTKNIKTVEQLTEKQVRPTEVHYDFDRLKSDDFIENPSHYADSYELTAEERDLVERIVMHEAGWCTDYRLLILTAQCIRNSCEINGIRPPQAYIQYEYAAMSYINPRSRQAVRDVFDRGIKCVDEDIFCYYNRNLTSSPLHESYRLAIDIGGNRFFY